MGLYWNDFARHCIFQVTFYRHRLKENRAGHRMP
jgi:hypothetical protein